MIQKGEISSRGAKIIIPKMLDEKLDPRQIAIRDALIQQNNIEEIEELADQIIKENDSIVKEYKNGKMSSIQYLIGQAMKKTKGSVNPSIIKDIIQKNGSWFSYGDTRLGQGLDNVSNLIGDNPELYDELVNKLKSDE